ncbi:hypothetical protein BCR34DRAFT_606628 [Clohesyomyces aquaticus]|uniref:Uncharacterized protein n=1 Tax=Clohesyomyces aquaticus TaxID=1231657 RepID=A0A1Y1YN26_9PLEO|nr:hypothetical protein BCR34DRAFT_606628 [Clohesyomyces aquaticus]
MRSQQSRPPRSAKEKSWKANLATNTFLAMVGTLYVSSIPGIVPTIWTYNKLSKNIGARIDKLGTTMNHQNAEILKCLYTISGRLDATSETAMHANATCNRLQNEFNLLKDAVLLGPKSKDKKG